MRTDPPRTERLPKVRWLYCNMLVTNKIAYLADEVGG